MNDANQRLATAKQIPKTSRRHVCHYLPMTATAMRVWCLLIGLSVIPASVEADPLLQHLTILAPAAPEEGRDQTARAMQHALQAEQIVRIVDGETKIAIGGTTAVRWCEPSHPQNAVMGTPALHIGQLSAG